MRHRDNQQLHDGCETCTSSLTTDAGRWTLGSRGDYQVPGLLPPTNTKGSPMVYQHTIIRRDDPRLNANQIAYKTAIQTCMKPLWHAEGPSATGAYFTRALGRGAIMQSGGLTGDVTVTGAYFTRAVSRGVIMQGGSTHKMNVQ